MAARMPHMQRRADSSVWQFRLRVPADLVEEYGRPDIRQSLGTRDTAAARIETARLIAHYEAEFTAKRRAKNPEKLHNVTPDLLAMLCERIRWRILSADDSMRYGSHLLDFLKGMEDIAPPMRLLAPEVFPAYLDPSVIGLTPDRVERLRQIEAVLDRGLTDAMTYGRFGLAQSFADSETRPLGFRIDWANPSNRSALLQIIRTVVASYRLAAERSGGAMVETPLEPAMKAPATAQAIEAPRRAQRSPGTTLFDVADTWAKVGPKKPDAIAKTQRALGLLKESGESVKLHEVTRHSGLAFKRFLMDQKARGFSGVTAGKHWHCVMAILNFAAHELALIESNPWKGTAAPTGKAQKRNPWSVEQLQRLFDSDLFARYALPVDKKAGADAAYWLQVMAIYSGARLHELAALRTKDFETRNGVPVFIIRKSKTSAGERTVPVHSELVRLGLLDLVADRRDGGADRMWSLNDQESRDGSTFYSDWHRTYRKAQGFTARLLDFHSFRHTAISVLRGVSPPHPETAIDQTVGHESVGSEGAKRYATQPVDSLRRVVESLRYPGLNLPRVYPARHA